jgi:predicted transcriptional regulator
LEKSKPAISIAKSVTDDFIICLEDGKRLKMLKRYLRSNFGLSPEDYRKKWGLPADYPMVAPNYAKRRSEFAKQIGLGRGVRAKV